MKFIFENNDFLVVEKPGGLLVHPTEKQEKNTLTGWLIQKYPEIKKVGDDPLRPGIVHRLDKDASGLLVIAKNQKIFEHLKDQFKKHKIEKEYLALVYGEIEKDEGVIDLPIGRSTNGKMGAVKSIKQKRKFKTALTEYKLVKKYPGVSLLKIKTGTGRTHQIRAHMKSIGHPVVGDSLYKAKLRWKKNIPPPPRLFLHAICLGFFDLKNKWHEFQSPPPAELKLYLDKLISLNS